VSVTNGAGPGRLDRMLRITTGVLGIVVAVPSFLAFLFIVLFVWLGSEDTPLWLALPLGLLAIVQLYLAIRTLSARLATAVTVGLLGVLELAVGVFLLFGSPTLLPATIAAIVVVVIAGVVAVVTAIRIHQHGPGEPEPIRSTPPQIRIGRKTPTSPDAPQPLRNGARAKPPGAAPKTGSTNKSGGKKSARKR